jgi:hypothetical protein
VRQNAEKGDFMAEKGAHMAPKRQKASFGAKMRQMTLFGELRKNIVFCYYFLYLFLFLLKE